MVTETEHTHTQKLLQLLQMFYIRLSAVSHLHLHFICVPVLCHSFSYCFLLSVSCYWEHPHRHQPLCAWMCVCVCVLSKISLKFHVDKATTIKSDVHWNDVNWNMETLKIIGIGFGHGHDLTCWKVCDAKIAIWRCTITGRAATTATTMTTKGRGKRTKDERRKTKTKELCRWTWTS